MMVRDLSPRASVPTLRRTARRSGLLLADGARRLRHAAPTCVVPRRAATIDTLCSVTCPAAAERLPRFELCRRCALRRRRRLRHCIAAAAMRATRGCAAHALPCAISTTRMLASSTSAFRRHCINGPRRCRRVASSRSRRGRCSPTPMTDHADRSSAARLALAVISRRLVAAPLARRAHAFRARASPPPTSRKIARKTTGKLGRL